MMANSLKQTLEDKDQEEQSASNPISIAEDDANEDETEPDVVEKLPSDQASQVAQVPSPVAPPAIAQQAAPAVAPAQLAVPAPPKFPTAQEYNAHDMAEMQDAATRKITPQTYASMFADKSTLGKIGTLFGLMLSGAGSGLAHQSNALLDMMNKLIDNDLNAQKTNVSNAQNFLNLSYGHEVQQAQIRKMEFENLATQAGIKATEAGTELTKTQTKKEAAAVKKAEAELQGLARLNKAKNTVEALGYEQAAKGLGNDQSALSGTPSAPMAAPVNNQTTPSAGGQQSTQNTIPHPDDMKIAGVAAPFRAKNRMLTAVSQYLGDAVANNPQGQAVFQNTIMPAIQAEQAKNNQQAEAAQNLASAQEEAPYQDVVTDRNRLNNMITLGRMNPKLPVNVAIHDEAQVNDEIAATQQLRNEYGNWASTFKELEALKNAGQVPASRMVGAAASSLGSILGGIGGSFLGHPVEGGIAGGVAGEGVGSALKEVFERKRNATIGLLQQRLGKNLDSILPSWSDDPQSVAAAWKKGVQNFKSEDFKLNRNLKTYGLVKPFPELKYEPVKANSTKIPFRPENKKQDFSVSGLPDLLQGEGD